MRNHEVTTIQPLLGPDGILQEPGWSRRPLQLYSRADIKKRPTRIKEWDYYSVLSPPGTLACALPCRMMGTLAYSP